MKYQEHFLLDCDEVIFYVKEKKLFPENANLTVKEIGVLQKADKSPCLISGVMHQGEKEMKKFLSKKTLRWLHDEVFNHAFTKEQQKLTIQWLTHHSW